MKTTIVYKGASTQKVEQLKRAAYAAGYKDGWEARGKAEAEQAEQVEQDRQAAGKGQVGR